jgi:tRNA(Ile)-lysidine synthase
MKEWLHQIPEKSVILAAVSGGPDSVYLLYHLQEAAREKDLRIEVAHINHCLRGEDSEADEKFVCDLAKKLGLNYHVRRFDQDGPQPSSTPNPNEKTLRHKRLILLKRVARHVGAIGIAFGHHRDDLAETFIINALRGSGPAGLEGMRPVREIQGGLLLIRPLLELRKAEVEEKLNEIGQGWRTDRSNNEETFRRNIIRKKLMPALEEIEPAAASNLAYSAEFCGEMFTVYTRAVRHAAVRTVLAASPRAILISMEALRRELAKGVAFGIIRTHFLNLLTQRTRESETPVLPRRDLMKQLISRLYKTQGDEAMFHLGESIMLDVTSKFALMYSTNSYEQAALETSLGFPFLVLAPEDKKSWSANTSSDGFGLEYIDCGPHSFEMSVSARDFPPEEYQAGEGEGCAFLDKNEVDGDLCCRQLDPNERITLSNGSSKSVRDCLAETAVPPKLRHMIAGVCDNKGILWIPGIRRSSRCWITENSRQVVELRTLSRQSQEKF